MILKMYFSSILYTDTEYGDGVTLLPAEAQRTDQ